MYRLVLSVLVSSVLLLAASSAYPDDEWNHPITFKPTSFVPKNDRDDSHYRLSGDIIPVNYNIWLQTRIHDLDFSFSGEVKITIHAVNRTDHIVLHSLQSKILEADLKDMTTNETFYLYDELDVATAFLTFKSVHADPLNLLPDREYLLTIKYEGNLRRDNGGFYLSTYQNEAGQTVYMATTQFQATDARHAFPCFDEPGYKATFDIAITHGNEFSALSNMPVDRSDTTSSTTKTTYFKTTPKMSTYLVAFIISDFVSTESQDGNVLHRIFSKPNARDQHSFALETSKKALAHFAGWLGVPYHLPKIDNVAIPDFGAGAMENWGLVTYREEYMLYDSKASTVNTELNIATIIAHEYAHQWFGDLVTPKWWQHLWLNEGFATLYEYAIIDAIYKDWDVMQHFAVSHFQRALLNDAQTSPRAMSTDVNTPAQISGLFDSVSYSKAGCVLRMIQHVLGDSVWQRGLNSYLTANSYGVVTEDHLFQHLISAFGSGTVAGLPSNQLLSFFKSWTNQGGSPILTVTRNYNAGTFEIRQEIFDNTNATTSNITFVVPYNFVYGNSPEYTNTTPHGFLNKERSITVSPSISHSRNDFLLLNKQSIFFYRVNYDETNWNLIISQLKNDHKKIDVANRAQLIDDITKLSLAGRVSHNHALRLLEYLRNEDQYAPWAATSNALSTLNTYLLGSEGYDHFEFFIRHLIEPVYKKLGVNERQNDTMHTKLSRNIAISWACRAKVAACMKETNDRLKEMISGTSIEPSLKAVVSCSGMISGGETEFSHIFRQILDSTDQAERRVLMPALGCSRNYTLLMEFAMTATAYSTELNYRPTERVNVLSSVIAQNEVGLEVAIKFLMNDHVAYYNLGSGGFTNSNPLLSILSSISSRIYTKELKDQFDELIAKVKTGPLGNAAQLDAMKARVVTNLEWSELNRDNYVMWFDKFRNSGVSTVLPSVTVLVTILVSLRSYF